MGNPFFHPLPEDTLFFDIETGGINAQKSSILSLSSGKKVGQVRSLYAEPLGGSYVSNWARENVLKKIQIQAPKYINEVDILTDFLQQLKSLRSGSTVAGWNIGYHALAQRTGIPGFDIPAIMERASKYGLANEFRREFGRLSIRDIGREFLAAIAAPIYQKYSNLPEEEIAQHIDPRLWKQLKPFGREVTRRIAEGGTIPEIAKQLTGFQVHGWKMETATELLLGNKANMAHLSSADVENMFSLIGAEAPTNLVDKWHKNALQTRLLSEAKFAVKAGNEIPWEDIMARAQRFGPEYSEGIKGLISKESPFFVEKGIEWSAAHSLMLRGPTNVTIKELASRMMTGKGMMIGAGIAAALYLMKPLAVFNQTDETIESVRAGNIANVPLNTESLKGFLSMAASLSEQTPSRRTKPGWLTSFEGELQKQVADKAITDIEIQRLVSKTIQASNAGNVMQLISGKSARKAFEEQIRWRNPEDASKVQTFLTERTSIGALGSFDPTKTKLKIGGLVDPGEVLAEMSKIQQMKSRTSAETSMEFLYSVLSPTRSKETALHEGLHAVWALDMAPEHKKVFTENTIAQLKATNSWWRTTDTTDIQQLAAKSPVYAAVINQAAYNAGNVFGSNKDWSIDWVANELFAHRGAALRYNTDTNYRFSQNKELDDIVSQYIAAGPRKELEPIYTGKNVIEALKRSRLTPDAVARLQNKQKLYVKDQQFSTFVADGRREDFNTISGLPENGLTAGMRHAITPFGSAWSAVKNFMLSPFNRMSRSERAVGKIAEYAKGTLFEWLAEREGGLPAFIATERPVINIYAETARTQTRGIFSARFMRRLPEPGFESSGQVFLSPGQVLPEIRINPRTLRAETLKALGQNISAERSLALRANAIYGHELSEAFHFLKAGGIGTTEFGTHMGPEVLKDEMLAAAMQGKQTLQDVMQFRSAELAAIKRKIPTLDKQKALKSIYYIKETEKMIKQFKKKIAPSFQSLFQERDRLLSLQVANGTKASFNTVEGLLHGGLMEKIRHLMTPFGGSVQAWKTLVSPIAEKILAAEEKGTAEKLVSHLMKNVTGKQSTVEVEGVKALVLKQLGEGQEGKAFLTWVPGKGKSVLKEAKELSGQMAFNPGPVGIMMDATKKKIIGLNEQAPLHSAIDAYMQRSKNEAKMTVADAAIFRTQREASMMRTARKQYGGLVPEVYGQEGRLLLMEHTGTSLESIMQKKNLSPADIDVLKQAKDKIRSFYTENWRSGDVLHADPHSGNITFTRKNGELQFHVIDWGSALKRDELARTAIDTRKTERYLNQGMIESMQKKSLETKTVVVQGPPNMTEATSERLQMMAALQKKTQRDLTYNAKFGGKLHRLKHN
jgi:hypothetical protein